MEGTPTADLRDTLAAERTFLAWIRTGLALMGFGFVVARFGLFLQEFELAQPRHALSPQSYGLSRWFGISLIAIGVIVNAVAGWHHARLVRELDRGGRPPSRPSAAAVAVACILVLVGLAMVIYLASIPSSLSP
jgi:putative membrane protein